MKIYTSGLLLLSACFLSVQAIAQTEEQPKNTVLVCRAHQCAETSYSMSQGFLFNKIDQMMKRNVGKAVLLCEADPVSHVCLNQGLEIPAQASFEQVDIKVDGLELTNEQLISGQTALEAVFDYKIRANKTFPKCQLGVSRLTVPSVDKVELATNDFTCHITETGRTAINATYNIDYLDFDYGFIGAYYTIGIGEAVQGDKTGYVLMRFTDKAPWEDNTSSEVAQEEDKTTVKTEKDVHLPEILKLTAPANEIVQENNPVVVPEEPVKKEVIAVPVQVEQEEQVSSDSIQTKKVVKTTIVEKTTILSDGTRQTEEPIKRTIIKDIVQ